MGWGKHANPSMYVEKSRGQRPVASPTDLSLFHTHKPGWQISQNKQFGVTSLLLPADVSQKAGPYPGESILLQGELRSGWGQQPLGETAVNRTLLLSWGGGSTGQGRGVEVVNRVSATLSLGVPGRRV